MLAAGLVALSAAIVLALGAVHLVYTFRGPKLTRRDPAVRAGMEATALVISRETTMWKAWVGFNASHGLGAVLFGLVYGYLAVVHPESLFGSGFLLGVGFVLLGIYAVIAKVYWFSVPFRGILIAWACYAAGMVAGLVTGIA